MKTLHLIVGTRPNYIKAASLYPLIKDYFDVKVVNTGQHFDYNMSDVFCEELNIEIHKNLLCKSEGNHAINTAKIMIEYNKFIEFDKPDLVIVLGDVDSTLACALVASKLNIPIAHIEAGLRSGDKTMPEEINRILVDKISNYLFLTERVAKINLRNEGHGSDNIYLVGNLMIDTLIKSKDKLKNCYGDYCVCTMHRKNNIENNVESVVNILNGIAKKISVIFPVHPHTKNYLKDYILNENIFLIEPQGYIKFMSLISCAKFVITDSGGLQPETNYLGIPCLVMRRNTEHMDSVLFGTNEIVNLQYTYIMKCVEKIFANKWKVTKQQEYNDGDAGKRILKVLLENFHK